MRIAIASDDQEGLKGQMSAHFGRCPFYTVVDVEDGQVLRVEVVENPYYQSHVPGMVPQFIKSLGAHVIIAGGMGPRAIEMFEQFGIEVVTTGGSAPVDEVLGTFLEGSLRGARACEEHHRRC